MRLKNDVWVIVPAYKEARNIASVLKDVKQFTNNIIVVDDGSSDNTAEVAKKYTPHVLHHVVNIGKGAALKTGVEFALEQHARAVVLIDSDGQHDPKDIPRFVDALQRHQIAFGVRRINKRMPVILRLGNIIISQITYVLHGIKLEDTQCGFRAFNTSIWKQLKWKSMDYGVESEMISNTGKYKLVYVQIPINTVYLDRYKGTTVLDGVKIVGQLIWRKMRG